MQQNIKTENFEVRRLQSLIDGMPATDGAGVELTRVIGQPALEMLDPFLMLDVMHSDNPDDYIAGFPPHPHRGFETVSYLLAGRFRHKDSVGNEGVLEPGGVQWMTAGRGIEHSEIPEQVDGLLHGFQLWINLPAAHKMTEPAYQEFAPERIPQELRDDGTSVRVVAGRTRNGTEGPIRQPLTDPYYFDVVLPPENVFEDSLPDGHNAFIYMIDGELLLPDLQGRQQAVKKDRLAVLGRDGYVSTAAGKNGARFLLVAGRPLGEPVARGGPFVMNTRAEILQAFEDYSSGRLVSPLAR